MTTLQEDLAHIERRANNRDDLLTHTHELLRRYADGYEHLRKRLDEWEKLDVAALKRNYEAAHSENERLASKVMWLERALKDEKAEVARLGEHVHDLNDRIRELKHDIEGWKVSSLEADKNRESELRLRDRLTRRLDDLQTTLYQAAENTVCTCRCAHNVDEHVDCKPCLRCRVIIETTKGF